MIPWLFSTKQAVGGVCDSLDKDQVIVTATANGNFSELYSNIHGGDPVNIQRGEGRLVQAGDEFKVVCYDELLGSTTANNLGVVLTKEFAVAPVDRDAYAPGKINGVKGHHRVHRS